ncbi:hypothetical protein F5148DRAFT_986925 [Russula earlei]|uniref:Uncharacterized protein n=1 Tax=Russula earlei TaxID=71964 RepID=A0ACC0TX90_9AGAM|nr:hypothetical protein F5148DRAFT_986925 [Russula earlei]
MCAVFVLTSWPVPVAILDQSPNIATHRDKWFGDLRMLMASFHKDRLVHGDLCEPNIVCKGEKVIEVSFLSPQTHITFP